MGRQASSLQQLCSYEGIEFIRAAYLTVLGRLPDEGGMTTYLGRLDDGVSKLTILRWLRSSAEARSHDPGIAGFDRALKAQKRANLPFVGWVFRQLNKGESDTPAARQHRALLRRMERIEAHLMAIHSDIEERLDEIALGRGGRRSYGIVPAAQQSAQPWSASGQV